MRREGQELAFLGFGRTPVVNLRREKGDVPSLVAFGCAPESKWAF